MWRAGTLCALSIMIISGNCEDTLKFNTKCPRDDWQCLTRVAQATLPRFVAGDPALGIEPLDPFVLKNYTTDLAGLMFSTTGQAKGYKNAHLDRVEFDFTKGVFKLNCRANMTLKGRYHAAGQLLFLPIQGDGDIKIKAVDTLLNITAPFETTTDSKGQQHLHFMDFNLDFEIIGYVHYTLTNLFNGNKALSDGMHQFLNTNWKLVSREFAAPVIKTGFVQFFSNMNQLFERMSLSDLFLE